MVNVRLRKVENIGKGLNRPVVLGEVIRDIDQKLTIALPQQDYGLSEPPKESSLELPYDLSETPEKSA